MKGRVRWRDETPETMRAAAQERSANARSVPIEERSCILPGCGGPIPTGSSRLRMYCCDKHAALDRQRRRRLRLSALSEIPTTQPCSSCGRHFTVPMYQRKRGRPKKSKCIECRDDDCEVERQARLAR